MKKLVLVLAIVFAFGVTYALNIQADSPKVATEQVSNNDEKDKKEAKSDKKKLKNVQARKNAAAAKKSCDEKK